LLSTTAGDSYTYDYNGNRITHGKGGQTDTYGYDFENRLVQINKQLTAPAPSSQVAGIHVYAYDYRTRRILRDESLAGGVATKVVFSGGTSVQEYGGSNSTLSVEYVRGSDYGGDLTPEVGHFKSIV